MPIDTPRVAGAIVIAGGLLHACTDERVPRDESEASSDSAATADAAANVEPRDSAAQADAGSDAATQALHEGVGHGVLRTLPGTVQEPSCAQQITVDFLDAPDQPVDSSCLPDAFEL